VRAKGSSWRGKIKVSVPHPVRFSASLCGGTSEKDQFARELRKLLMEMHPRNKENI
jgi:hypothetical protein